MDLKEPRWMYAKALMFLLIGSLSFALIVLEHASLRGVVLMIVMVWAFCRAYYFVFYVIEKYIDSGYRFSGLIDFFCYLLKRKN